MTRYSVLDLAPIVEGSDASQSLSNSTELVQHAEALGYHRYWVAEHHNMRGIASSATAVVIGHLAGASKTIRVGAGGIMLPNHAPLVIAEQFGTLASLYPGRIDLGLGRAPGTDQVTMHGFGGRDHQPIRIRAKNLSDGRDLGFVICGGACAMRVDIANLIRAKPRIAQNTCNRTARAANAGCDDIACIR